MFVSWAIVAALGVMLVLPGRASGAGDETKADRTNNVSGGKSVITEHRSGEWTPGLSDAEKETLFAIATDALAWCTRKGKEPFDFSTYALTDKLKEKAATFVTLKTNVGNELRGCIGTLEPRDPLYYSVYTNACNAAMNDTRFEPVTPRELKGLDVHISILSPVKDIASLEEFKLGEHGIILTKMMFRSVFLPEVAVEQKWTREQTLSHLSRKAGLPSDSWKQGAKFKVFSSVVLSK